MASKTAPTIELALRLGEATTTAQGDITNIVEVVMTNRSTSPITVVSSPRYFLIEMKSALGQYFKGAPREPKPMSLPTSRDYHRLPPDGAFGVWLALVWTPPSGDDAVGAYSVGGLYFPDVPARNTLRVTYRADQVMPNLPNADRRLFFGGPLDGVLELLAGSPYRAPPAA